MTKCLEFNVMFSYESPWPSWAWIHPGVCALWNHPQVAVVRFFFGDMGAPYRKETAILHNMESLHALADFRCRGDASLPVGASYPSRGGLKADDAVALLQDFYTSGNPNGAKLSPPSPKGGDGIDVAFSFPVQPQSPIDRFGAPPTVCCHMRSQEVVLEPTPRSIERTQVLRKH